MIDIVSNDRYISPDNIKPRMSEMRTKRPKPDQIFPTREVAEAKINELQASLDPGERRYEVVAEVTGYSIDVYRRDGYYAGPL